MRTLLIALFLTAFLVSTASSQQPPPSHEGRPPASPSPEVLRALSDLITATTGHPAVRQSAEWWSPDGLRSVTGLVSALAWPVLIGILVFVFREPLKNVTELEAFGVKAKIQKRLDQSAQAAEKSEGLSKVPTPGELKRAQEVEELTSKIDLSVVRQQIDELAAEYERVRASMRPGDTRTRAMEIVVSKMRTIGRAAYPLRHELSVSPSPGRRLQAIASLQVIPDYDDLLMWLADRIDAERPFIGYHAVVALNTAAADERAGEHISELEQALARAKDRTKKLSADTDRAELLQQFAKKVDLLRQASAATRAKPT